MHFGGAENYLLTIVSRWIENGDDAIIIARKDSPFASTVSKVIKKAKLIEVKYRYKDIKFIRKILNDESVDILDVNGINSGLFTLIVNYNIPKLTTVHSNAEMDRSEKTWLIRKLFVIAENICLKRSEKIIVVSESLEKLLIERGIDRTKIQVVHNGVKQINYNDRKYRINKDDILNICFIGRLEKVKGCDTLIRALSKVRDDNFLCDIYGVGSEETRLKEMVVRENIEKKVFFKGFSNGIRDFLPNYDIFILPSMFEAFPLTILEAMNAKVLVICSNVGGIPYIIEDNKTGYIFEKKDYIRLAQIIDMVNEDRSLIKDITLRAYDKFINTYTEDIMTRKTILALKAIIS